MPRWPICTLVFVLGLLWPHQRPAMVDITKTSGLVAFRHVMGDTRKRYLIEATGSGVALVDVDGDGWLDIYLINGATYDGPASSTSAALFLNRRDGTFVDITSTAGLANQRWGQGVCAGDVNGDDLVDLYVTNFGKNRLYLNSATQVFRDVAETAGVAVDDRSTGCAFADYDRDGDLDLFVAGFVRFDLAAPPPAAPMASDTVGPRAIPGIPSGCFYRGYRVMCGPRGLPGAADHLFQNDGQGRFRDVSRQANVSDDVGRYGFGVAWADLDGDGWSDLVVSNDSGPNFVYHNRRDGTFKDVGYVSGAAVDGSGRDQAHMGIAIGDYNNDGWDDIHITTFSEDFNVLYRAEGALLFADVSRPSGVEGISYDFLGWGTDFFDVDHDGWMDLFVANGHIYPQADFAGWKQRYQQRSQLLRNREGRTFEDVGATLGPALMAAHSGRGSAVGDIDNDGDIDVVVNNLDEPPTLLRNDAVIPGNHWISIELRGAPGRVRDAIGAVVTCRVGNRRMRRMVASGRGHMSQSDLRVHFGLGKAAAIDELSVRWPNGRTQSYVLDRVDAHVRIDESTGTVRYR